jgi:hypothetical protein
MDATRKRNVLFAAVGGLVVVGLLWFVFAGGDGRLREVTGESKEAREAMQVIQAIARDPKSVPEHLCADTPAGVQKMVTDVAEHMGGAESIQFESAGWWGGYMRVRVSWPRAEGEPLSRTFFFQEEGGRLRIRGLQL